MCDNEAHSSLDAHGGAVVRIPPPPTADTGNTPRKSTLCRATDVGGCAVEACGFPESCGFQWRSMFCISDMSASAWV
ncbi:hypothetical protein PHLGIDRAFT_384093 [Phlebiopsis gigantea 11061_1 CR5-6]|uniref:Uncharacterized protein n=1 Tax=Phlebiopsis gigantea (strain 11061_1 CR5-6) TaxID=745531 RepID=A0A0C3N9K7_PHLG1|nr:hypothetical protein PHLGIDRAFT_384093 [Phlebiopsis gigantea 11061_1 CR5-6]